MHTGPPLLRISYEGEKIPESDAFGYFCSGFVLELRLADLVDKEAYTFLACLLFKLPLSYSDQKARGKRRFPYKEINHLANNQNGDYLLKRFIFSNDYRKPCMCKNVLPLRHLRTRTRGIFP